MASDKERIAVLEANMGDVHEDLGKMEKSIKGIHVELSALNQTLSKQRGIITGATMVLTALWGLFLVSAKSLWDWLT